jgi:hypothetical protein
MSGQVVLYFEDQADALRFALAAGSVMAGDGAEFSQNLVEETTRATRVCLDAVNAPNSNSTSANPGTTNSSGSNSSAKKNGKSGHAA